MLLQRALVQWRCTPHAFLRSLSSTSGAPNSREEQEPTYTIKQQRSGGRVASWKAQGTSERGFIFTDRALQEQSTREGAPHGLYTALASTLKGVLLPYGYPRSVGQGYLEFSLLQGLTNTAMTANSVVASTFLLYAVGLGTGAGIATAGALNWVLKDGLGQLGTLAFGKVVNHQFDCHSKTWFFLSAVMLKAATGVEIATALFPTHFLVLGTVANSLKGLAWMASSSTRSVFMLSFVRDSNLADLTAKSTSQWICASILGTALGAWICTAVGQDTRAAAGVFLALTACSLAGAFATVKTVALPTLNTTRLQLLCEEYLQQIGQAAASRQLQRRAQLASAFGPDSLLSSSVAPPGGLPPSSSSSSPSSSSPHEGMFAGALANLHHHHHHSQQQQHRAHARQQHAGVAALHAAGGARRAAGEGHAGGSWACGWDAAGALEGMLDEFLDPTLPSPVELASEDPPLPFLMGDPRLLDPAVVVGEALERMFEDASPEVMVLCVNTYRLSHAMVLPRGSAVHVLLHQEAQPRDVCQAYLQACLLRRRIRAGSAVHLAMVHHAAELQAKRLAEEEQRRQWQQHDSDGDGGGDGGVVGRGGGRGGGGGVALVAEEMPNVTSSSQALAELRIVLQDTLQTSERLTSPFLRSLEAAGWKLDKVLVEGHKRRARW